MVLDGPYDTRQWEIQMTKTVKAAEQMDKITHGDQYPLFRTHHYTASGCAEMQKKVVSSDCSLDSLDLPTLIQAKIKHTEMKKTIPMLENVTRVCFPPKGDWVDGEFGREVEGLGLHWVVEKQYVLKKTWKR